MPRHQQVQHIWVGFHHELQSPYRPQMACPKCPMLQQCDRPTGAGDATMTQYYSQTAVHCQNTMTCYSYVLGM